jgi:hypothetical protein
MSVQMNARNPPDAAETADCPKFTPPDVSASAKIPIVQVEKPPHLDGINRPTLEAEKGRHLFRERLGRD